MKVWSPHLPLCFHACQGAALVQGYVPVEENFVSFGEIQGDIAVLAVVPKTVCTADAEPLA